MFWRILIIVLIVLAAALVLLFVFGRRAQKRQAEQQEQIEAAKQTVSMLIIDKKRLRLRDSGLPQAAIEQTPKYLRRSKYPIVKAKVGPRVMTMMCEPNAYEQLPVKKEVKAVISGIYIVEVKSVRGGHLETPQRKRGAVARLRDRVGSKAQELSARQAAGTSRRRKR